MLTENALRGTVTGNAVKKMTYDNYYNERDAEYLEILIELIACS